VSDDDHGPTPRPFSASLCWTCEAHRRVDGARTTFLMCTALPVKYPPQPVRACPAYRQTGPSK
jgi:hypothetical protein